MTEEEVLAVEAASPSPADLKRKHNESEPLEDVNQNGNKADDDEAVDAKRPRLDEEEKPESLVSDNGFQADKIMEPAEGEEEPSEEKNSETEISQQTTEEALEAPQQISEDAPEAPKQTTVGASEAPQQTSEEAPEAPQQTSEEAPEGLDGKQASTNDQQDADIQPPTGENLQLESENQKPSETERQEPSAEEPAPDNDSMSRKMEVPNDKVGVLIGKGGETIRYLQFNSGAKIQIMRDADVDPQSTNRPVELIGGLDNINKAEKLIKDVIAEADAGGSPALVAKGFGTAQTVGAVDQVLIQVPNEKVGVIIGKGGDTIKNLQTRSGARIQLIPQHLPEGDQSKERTVRVSGDKKQIERAREMIKEVMNQPPRQASSGGYNQQQSFRPRGPSSQQQWGSRGPNASHPSGYDYQQRGYPSQNSQHQNHGYGNYPPRSGPRGNYNSGWERPPPMQGPPHQGGGGGYDYYGPGPNHSNPHPSHGPGPNHSNMGPPSQGNYNYGQPHGQPPYPSQGYGQGYGENKYENQGPGHQQQPYSAPQPQYGKAPPYGVPPHGAPAQNYGQPRPTQQVDVPYQGGPAPVQQPYGQSAVPPQQQSYPYAGSGQVPQSYPPYAPAPGAEGYNQPQPAPASAQMYPQQSGQPVGQQAPPGYAQVAGYGAYPAQQGYGDPSTQNNVAYGYNQGVADPAYGGGAAYGAPMAGQVGYAQPVPAQQYDQSAPNPGGYGGVPAAQMYGAVPAPTPAPR